MSDKEVAELTREDIQAMDPMERVSLANSIRDRILKKEDISKIEVHNALRLVRIERTARLTSKKARSKQPPTAVNLDEF